MFTKLVTLEIHKDKRGSFTELFIEKDIKQISFSISLPNIIRAWHKHKKQTDYICVLKGKVKICVSDNKKIEEYILWGGELQVLKIPKNLWHGTKNIGGNTSYILYGVTKKYNKKDPDEQRKSEIVVKGEKYVW